MPACKAVPYVNLTPTGPPRHEATSTPATPCTSLPPLPQLWEGFETTNANILVLGATNKKERLDDAVLRRFSLQYEVRRGLCLSVLVFLVSLAMPRPARAVPRHISLQHEARASLCLADAVPWEAGLRRLCLQHGMRSCICISAQCYSLWQRCPAPRTVLIMPLLSHLVNCRRSSCPTRGSGRPSCASRCGATPLRPSQPWWSASCGPSCSGIPR